MLISSQMARAIPEDSPLHPFILYSPNSAFKLACEIVRPSFADFDTNLSLSPRAEAEFTERDGGIERGRQWGGGRDFHQEDENQTRGVPWILDDVPLTRP